MATDKINYKHSIKISKFCDDNNIPYIYVPFEVISGKKHLVKELIPTGWNKWTYEKCIMHNDNIELNEQYKWLLSINIRKSPYMVIDVDDASLIKETLDTFHNDWISFSSSKSFPHLWRKKMQDDNSPNDIKVDGKDIDYCFDTIYEKVDGCIYYNNKINYDSDDYCMWNPQDHRNPLIGKIKENNYDNDSGIETSSNISNGETKSLLEDLLNHLKIDRIESYMNWFKLGALIYNIDDSQEGLKLFINISSKTPKYARECKSACEEKWEQYIKDKEGKKGKPLTIATLWNWVKDDLKDNYSKYIELRSKYCHNHHKDVEFLIQLNNQDCAKLFANTKPNNYLYNKELGWYALNEKNIWKTYNGEPTALKNDIATTLKEWVHDCKDNELLDYNKKCSQLGNTDEDREKQKKMLKDHKINIELINKSYKSFGDARFIKGVIDFLPEYYYKEDLDEIMDSNRNIFAFDNCVFDLIKNTPRPIEPDDYISFTCGYNLPTESNKTIRDEIITFLNSIYDDKDLVEYVLKVYSSCLYGGNRFEEFYQLTGSGGNGKGTLNDLIAKVFGNYYMSFESNLLTKVSNKKDEPMPVLVDAKRKRVLMTTEPEHHEKVQVGIIKRLSGNDEIQARNLNSRYIVKYIPHFKVFIQVNDLLGYSKIDGGLIRRDRIIPHIKRFVKKEDFKNQAFEVIADPDIKEIKCKSNEWRNEFILLLIETYNKIKDFKSIPVPIQVKEATQDNHDSNNGLKQWLDINYNITTLNKDVIKKDTLINQYKVDNETNSLDLKWFKSMLGVNKVYDRKSGGINYYYGLIRRTDEEITLKKIEFGINE